MNNLRLSVASNFRFAAILVGIFVPSLCHSHNWNVHECITDSAYQSSDALSTFLNENLEAATLEATVPLVQPNVSDTL